MLAPLPTTAQYLFFRTRSHAELLIASRASMTFCISFGACSSLKSSSAILSLESVPSIRAMNRARR
ncbi:MAG: hypothetical protein BWY99_02849 [Synergistetes bacterium ADurb.BinA166]|nr:MAG: hypothetical protein BWY99_02849 [Synergistetes bacterium ADurb.BinA166]